MPQPELLCVNPTTASPLATKHARSRTPSPCAWVPGAENLPAGLSDVARMQQRGIRERPSGRGVCPNIQRCAMNPGFHCISSGLRLLPHCRTSRRAGIETVPSLVNGGYPASYSVRLISPYNPEVTFAPVNSLLDSGHW